MKNYKVAIIVYSLIYLAVSLSFLYVIALGFSH